MPALSFRAAASIQSCRADAGRRRADQERLPACQVPADVGGDVVGDVQDLVASRKRPWWRRPHPGSFARQDASVASTRRSASTVPAPADRLVRADHTLRHPGVRRHPPRSTRQRAGRNGERPRFPSTSGAAPMDGKEARTSAAEADVASPVSAQRARSASTTGWCFATPCCATRRAAAHLDAGHPRVGRSEPELGAPEDLLREVTRQRALTACDRKRLGHVVKAEARLARNTQRLAECYPPFAAVLRRVLDALQAQGSDHGSRTPGGHRRTRKRPSRRAPARC